MYSIYIYPICLIMFALCLGVVDYLKGRGSSDNLVLLTAAMLGFITFLLQYFPPPGWLMADYEKAYLPAGKAALFDHSAMPDLLTKGVVGFVNLPIVAYLIAPFALLPFYVGEAIFLLLGFAAGILLWRELARLLDLQVRESALILFLVIGAGPSGYNLINGNTSQIVMLLVVFGLASYMRGRDYGAGVLWALAALIKPALIILGIFALLRGRWKIALSGGLVCIASTLSSILIFGWPMHVLWLEQTILPALDGTIMAHNVQSIGAVISRAIVGAEHLHDWTPHAVPDVAQWLTRLGQLLTVVTITTSITLLARQGRAKQTAPLEVSLVLMIPLLTPNLSWSHYLIWTFLPLALCLRSVPAFKTATWFQLSAVASAALIAQPVQMWWTSSPLPKEVFGRFVVSLPFLGVVILLALLVKLTLDLHAGTSDQALVSGTPRKTAFEPPLKIPFLTRD